MICDRCGKREAVDIFPCGYDGDGNPMDEEALCESCIFEDDAEETLRRWDEEETILSR